MDGLIVIHTEISNLDPNEQSFGTPEQVVNLFDRIAHEMGEQIKRGNKVYLLGEESKLPEGELIYPAIRGHFPDLTYVPMNHDEARSYDMQALRLKERVMADGIERSQVTGINYEDCVLSVYQLLVGEFYPWRVGDFHRVATRNSGWSQEKIEEMLNTKLNAEIREDLTDKLFRQD